ncbi:MAG: winged helix DNA-binding domain-containing protein [Chloroflexota bacterium]|nr:winged helix DNA-binding domain-containing protein [Chloroflexota bacterium]
MSLFSKISSVNRYLAHKQHLLPTSRLADVVQVTRDIVALHATSATSPYLSLWARVPDFQREMLEDALYEQRTLAKVLCMRVTLHAVPSDEATNFIQACRAYVERRTPPRFRNEGLLVQAGICQAEEASVLLKNLYCRVLDALAEKGPSTLQEISQQVPELKTKIRHDVGKPYEGEFSIGSRLVHGMCAQGLLIRTRPRGTWRSSLYEYAALSDWLPDVDLDSVTTEEARAWLVRHYLDVFGPATLDDVQWWTGFSKGETKKALGALEPELVEVTVEGLGDGYWMLAEDAQRLRDFASTPPDAPYAFFLPSLDPYIMGYRDRRRFLTPEHRAKLFDRAGNAVPTVWVNGQVVGAWGQQKDGSVIYGLFEAVGEEEQALLEGEIPRLEGFLGDEYLPPYTHTPFTRAL